MRTPIRVAVVGPHGITRAGLVHLLALDPVRAEVVAAFDEVVELPEHDVALFDLTHRHPHSRDLRLLLKVTDKPVVALVSLEDVDVVARARALGVAQMITMGVTTDELHRSLEAARRRPTASAAERRALSRERAGSSIGLTARQIDIVELIAAGESNHAIAAQLYLSINTVKTNIRLAYSRMGVSSRSQAVLWALQHDLSD